MLYRFKIAPGCQETKKIYQKANSLKNQKIRKIRQNMQFFFLPVAQGFCVQTHLAGSGTFMGAGKVRCCRCGKGQESSGRSRSGAFGAMKAPNRPMGPSGTHGGHGGAMGAHGAHDGYPWGP